MFGKSFNFNLGQNLKLKLWMAKLCCNPSSNKKN